MDRVESLLCETLMERADHAPTGPVPLPNRSRWWPNAAMMAAASVAVIAIVALAIALHPSGDRGHQRTSPNQPNLPNLPGGIRIASYGGVSVRVPASLPTRTSLCGGPVAQQVVADSGQTSLCPVAANHLASNPGTVVWLTDRPQLTPYSVIPTSPVTVDGLAAERGYATGKSGLGVGVSGIVRFPKQDISIGVTAPTRNEVDAVLSTIVIAPTDPLGCTSQPGAAAATPPGPSTSLVRASPTTVVRCEYGIGTSALVASYTLDESKTTQLVSALNALVPDPCGNGCVHGGTPTPGHDEILYFHYQDGTVLRIDGSIGANLDTWTNQKRTVANFSSSITMLLDHLTNQR